MSLWRSQRGLLNPMRLKFPDLVDTWVGDALHCQHDRRGNR